MKSRRTALLVACLSASLAASLSLRAEDQVTITFAGSGGVLQEAETKYYFEPFMKAHPNVKIQQDSPINYAKLQAMVEADNVTWDLAEGGPGFVRDTIKAVNDIRVSDADRELIYEGNAKRMLRLKLP